MKKKTRATIPRLAKRRTGAAAGRKAALQEFDWKVVGDRIATEILAREGRRRRRWR